jgi:hypothetical protein
MRSKCVLALVTVFLLAAVSGHAAVLRVVMVETSDAAAYVKALEQGKTLMKAKGLPANVRIWRARFAGVQAGSVAVGIEYANLEALAKADATMASDPELRAWLQGLDKFRKIVSDSVYEEMTP